jgi:hypothetical protein
MLILNDGTSEKAAVLERPEALPERFELVKPGKRRVGVSLDGERRVGPIAASSVDVLGGLGAVKRGLEPVDVPDRDVILLGLVAVGERGGGDRWRGDPGAGNQRFSAEQLAAADVRGCVGHRVLLVRSRVV